LALQLLLLMAAAPALSSCSDTSDENSVVTDTSVITSAEVTEAVSPMPDVRFDGEEVRFMTVESITHPGYNSYAIYADSFNGDLINDCVFERNLEVEQTLNVKITEDKVNEAHNVVYQNIMSGSDTHDIVTPYLNYSFSNAVEGQYINLYDIPYLNLDSPWWDQRANDNLSIGGKLYFTTGDIDLLDNDCTAVLFFNKMLRDEYELSDPYTLVKNGGWTMDIMFEDSFKITQDLNGDGNLDYDNDRFGFFCHSNAPLALFLSGGANLIEKDEEGELKITIDNERASLVFDKMLTYCNDSRTGINAKTSVVAPVYLDNRIYLAAWSLSDILKLRDSEYDFGIIPHPKYNEEQDEYYCMIGTAWVPGISIPITNSNTELAGAVLEAMAFLSSEKLTKAYYDVTLTQKYFRDTESAEMLDIIFSSRVFDIGYVTGIGDLSSIPYSLNASKSTDFASAVAKVLPASNAELSEIVLKIGSR